MFGALAALLASLGADGAAAISCYRSPGWINLKPILKLEDQDLAKVDYPPDTFFFLPPTPPPPPRPLHASLPILFLPRAL